MRDRKTDGATDGATDRSYGPADGLGNGIRQPSRRRTGASLSSENRATHGLTKIRPTI